MKRQRTTAGSPPSHRLKSGWSRVAPRLRTVNVRAALGERIPVRWRMKARGAPRSAETTDPNGRKDPRIGASKRFGASSRWPPGDRKRPSSSKPCTRGGVGCETVSARLGRRQPAPAAKRVGGLRVANGPAPGDLARHLRLEDEGEHYHRSCAPRAGHTFKIPRPSFSAARSRRCLRPPPTRPLLRSSSRQPRALAVRRPQAAGDPAARQT
jgi:hypothetical protein